MFNRILIRMREKIREQAFVMTLHAEEEMSDDGCTIYDVENAILIGEIVERQKDANTDEWKYCIAGQTQEGDALEIVAKLSPNW